MKIPVPNSLFFTDPRTGLISREWFIYLERIGVIDSVIASLSNSVNNMPFGNRDGEDGQDGMSIQGPQGIQGATGLTIRGQDGEDGNDGMTIQGPQGIQGIAGLTIRGNDGEDGNDGFSPLGSPVNETSIIKFHALVAAHVSLRV